MEKPVFAFCILWRNPSTSLRLVITIVIYIAVARYIHDAAATGALGGGLGYLVATGPCQPLTSAVRAKRAESTP